MRKTRSGPGGVVFSTDPSIKIAPAATAEPATLPVAQQKLRVRLETKQRGGKAVTVIAGFEGAAADLEALGKQLKAFCGTGGSTKDGEILIQGDQRDKILPWLAKNGYALVKRR